MNKKLISAKEVIKKFNISYPTLNNYTDLGLLDVVIKKSKVRMYDYNDVRNRLAKISKLSSEGYTLKLIRGLLK